jgi:hypothetical protein
MPVGLQTRPTVGNSRGERRVSPSTYKLLLTTHIMVSVGWLGASFAKMTLGWVAILDSSANYLFSAMEALNVSFPPLAVATALTGVLLSLGTRWGLLDYYWVVTKLALTLGVIVSGVRLTDNLVDQALAGSSAALMALAVVHVLMLATASVLSVYKPWGKTWFGRGGLARLRVRAWAEP